MALASDGTRRDLLKCSYLTKAPPGSDGFTFRQWRRRWFMLCDSAIVYPMAPRNVRLEYYENEEAANGMVDPKGIIDLSECTAVKKSERAIKGHKFVFSVITDHREYYLSSDSAAERNTWVEMLHAVTADDFKAREYREYLRQSKVYNSDPGPAMMAMAASAGLASVGSSPPREAEKTTRTRPHSVANMHQIQASTAGQSMSELPSPPQPGPAKRDVYTEVNLNPAKKLNRQRQSAPGLLGDPESAPPVPRKNQDIYEEDDRGVPSKMGLGASQGEKTMTIEQNGKEIEALQPRRFGDSDPFTDSGEAMQGVLAGKGPYQNLPHSMSADSLPLGLGQATDKRTSVASYDHVVHQPSVRHKGAPRRQDAEDGIDDYSEIPDEIGAGASMDENGYKQVRHASALPPSRHAGGYEDVFPKQLPTAASVGSRPQLKRVSSLDMKKKLGVNALSTHPTPVPMARSTVGVTSSDSRGNSGYGYDRVSPAPSPKLRHPGPPSAAKPSRAPKPQRSLSPPHNDDYSHLTPPSSPNCDRRASDDPGWSRPVPHSRSGGPPSAGVRLSPGASPQRRVSSPNILDEGHRHQFSAMQLGSGSGTNSPNVPPRNMRPAGDSHLAPPRNAMRKSKSVQAMGRDLGLDGILQQQGQAQHSPSQVPDLHFSEDYPDDIYDQAS